MFRGVCCVELSELSFALCLIRRANVHLFKTCHSQFLSTSLHLVLLISEGIGMNCHRIDLRFRGRSMLGINFNFFERVKGVETVDQFSKYGVLKYNFICNTSSSLQRNINQNKFINSFIIHAYLQI